MGGGGVAVGAGVAVGKRVDVGGGVGVGPGAGVAGRLGAAVGPADLGGSAVWSAACEPRGIANKKATIDPRDRQMAKKPSAKMALGCSRTLNFIRSGLRSSSGGDPLALDATRGRLGGPP